MKDFNFTRRDEVGLCYQGESLAKAFGLNSGRKESWVFVGPHDDDPVLGAGLTILAAVAAGIKVCAVIVTDGSMGYSKPDEINEIVSIRKEETIRSFEILGVPAENVLFLDFPDASLEHWRGRWKESGSSPTVIHGCDGLRNSLTAAFRRFGATWVFYPTGKDIHPDHQQVAIETEIAAYHAGGDAWMELGEGNGVRAQRAEYMVYCEPDGTPTHQIRASESNFARKMEAIRAFRSQGDIGGILPKTEDDGPYEFLWVKGPYLSSTRKYRELFEG